MEQARRKLFGRESFKDRVEFWVCRKYDVKPFLTAILQAKSFKRFQQDADHAINFSRSDKLFA